MEKLKKYKYSIIWAVIMLIGCTAKFCDELKPEPFLPHLDKIVHFGIFAILGYLCTYERKKAHWSTLLLCTLYGIVIEIIQSFLSWRSFEVLDMVFDAIGAGAGIIFAKFLHKSRIK